MTLLFPGSYALAKFPWNATLVLGSGMALSLSMLGGPSETRNLFETVCLPAGLEVPF